MTELCNFLLCLQLCTLRWGLKGNIWSYVEVLCKHCLWPGFIFRSGHILMSFTSGGHAIFSFKKKRSDSLLDIWGASKRGNAEKAKDILHFTQLCIHVPKNLNLSRILPVAKGQWKYHINWEDTVVLVTSFCVELFTWLGSKKSDSAALCLFANLSHGTSFWLRSFHHLYNRITVNSFFSGDGKKHLGCFGMNSTHISRWITTKTSALFVKKKEKKAFSII